MLYRVQLIVCIEQFKAWVDGFPKEGRGILRYFNTFFDGIYHGSKKPDIVGLFQYLRGTGLFRT